MYFEGKEQDALKETMDEWRKMGNRWVDDGGEGHGLPEKNWWIRKVWDHKIGATKRGLLTGVSGMWQQATYKN